MNDSTNTQKILEGCLLGDGHLELHKNGKNASFIYNSSSKEHVEYVHNFFLEYCTDNYQKVHRREYFDNRTNKTYVTYGFKTKSLPFFTKEHDRFYVNRVKIVPRDLEMNNKLLLFWYVGDGELDSVYGYIKLHTNSFKYEEILFLCEILSKYGAKPQKKKENEYLISIPRKKVKSFLKYIGTCPINDYLHKWNEVPYANKNIELNGINNYIDVYPDIINDFICNNETIYQLSKKYSVPIKCIKNHFNNNEIQWKPINNKKRILQYDLFGNVVNEWESGQEIKKSLKYNPSAISECCRGLRKKYMNYIWKFKK